MHCAMTPRCSICLIVLIQHYAKRNKLLLQLRNIVVKNDAVNICANSSLNICGRIINKNTLSWNEIKFFQEGLIDVWIGLYLVNMR